MKVKNLIVVLLLLAFSNMYSFAQESEIPKSSSNIDAAVGFGADLFSVGLSWNKTHGIGSSKKFRIGYGVRIASLSGKNLNYSTAPAKLAADLTKVDTLLVSSSNTIGLNALINLQYQFSKKFMIGFNIDAIGLGFGSKSEGKFIAPEAKDLNGSTQSAKPTSLNVLLVGNNDIGNLKSELYAGYAVSNKMWVRGGFDFTFSELTTDKILTQENDRFRYKAGMLFLGLSYNL